MLLHIARRVTGLLLSVSLAVVAVSACTSSNAMAMAEMVCCAEHHDNCEMASQMQTCCPSDLQSAVAMLAPERTETALHAPRQIAAALADAISLLSTLSAATARTDALDAVYYAGPRPHVLSSVLLI